MVAPFPLLCLQCLGQQRGTGERVFSWEEGGVGRVVDGPAGSPGFSRLILLGAMTPVFGQFGVAAALNGGLYASYDYGLSWTQLPNTKVPEASWSSVRVQASGRKILAMTLAGAVYTIAPL